MTMLLLLYKNNKNNKNSKNSKVDVLRRIKYNSNEY